MKVRKKMWRQMFQYFPLSFHDAWYDLQANHILLHNFPVLFVERMFSSFLNIKICLVEFLWCFFSHFLSKVYKDEFYINFASSCNIEYIFYHSMELFPSFQHGRWECLCIVLIICNLNWMCHVLGKSNTCRLDLKFSS